MFQPAEEGVRGARAIVENGHLEDVDFLLAAHMYGGSEQHPCGICITAGHGLATTKLDVDFHGKASHAAAAPEQGNNALLAAATAVVEFTGHSTTWEGGYENQCRKAGCGKRAKYYL
ncbi:MAG: M20/M25/M40 family metallo-hydrolase [Clostridium sp.]